jgi:YD repeat-containing protein
MKKLKSVREYIRPIIDNQEAETRYLTAIHEFNEDEQNTLAEEYDHRGNLLSLNKYEYSNNGVLVKEIRHLSETGVTDTVEMSYNLKGVLEKETTTYQDGSSVVTTIEINDAERTVKKVSIDDDGDLDGIELQRFDENGNDIEHTWLDENKAITRKVIKEYDENGQQITELEYGYDNIFTHRIEWTFDKKKLVEECLLTEEGKIIQKSQYNYNSNDLVIQMTQNDGRQMMNEYDDQDRVIKEEVVDTNNDLILSRTTYQYGVNNLVESATTYEMGEQYAMEPEVFGRSKSHHNKREFEYEFFEND